MTEDRRTSRFVIFAKQQFSIGILMVLTMGVGCVYAQSPAPRVLLPYDAQRLVFEENRGQSDNQVDYVARGRGYRVFLSPQDSVLSLHRAAAATDPGNGQDPGSPTPPGRGALPTMLADAPLRVKFIGAKPHPQAVGTDPLPGKTNYFLGNRPSKWLTDITEWSRVVYQDIYPNIDLAYYGDRKVLEYDVIVRPGGDPTAIRLGLVGVKDLNIDTRGNLVLTVDDQTVTMARPIAYQDINGQRRNVEAHYILRNKADIRIAVDAYDHTQPLVIDPTLLYSTYLGGGDSDRGNGIAVDNNGNVFVVGNTCSSDFPVLNPIQSTPPASCSAFISKFSPTGARLASTYFGGSSGSDSATGVAVDSSGNIYIVGSTASTDFPTVSAAQTTYGGYTSDAFVTKFNNTLSSIVYSTYVGGTAADNGTSIAVDSAGSAYIAGYTRMGNFPVVNAIQPTRPTQGYYSFDAFVTKLAPNGASLLYSTYLGGNVDDIANGIAVDSAGNAYVTGYTTSNNFPTVNPISPYMGGHSAQNIFVSKINPSGSALVQSGYFGGNWVETSYGIAVDSAGAVWVTGYTLGSSTANDFPVTAGAPQASCITWSPDIFISKLDLTTQTVLFSTCLGTPATPGGSQYNSNYGFAIAVDALGNAYVGGESNNSLLPVVNGGGIQGNYVGIPYARDGYVVSLSSSGAIQFASYLGGSADDSAAAIAVSPGGTAYVTGYTSSSNFPTINASQSQLSGDANSWPRDAFVAKIGAVSGTTTSSVSLSASPTAPTCGQTVTFSSTVTGSGGTPTGRLTFSDGTTQLTSVTLASGSASFATSSLTPGTHNIIAAYSGDNVFAPSVSSTLSLTIAQPCPTTTQLNFPYTWKPGGTNSPFDITATVTSNFGTPTGTFTLTMGSTTIGTATLNSQGAATFTVPGQQPGVYNFSGSYSGSATKAASSGTTVRSIYGLNVATDHPRVVPTQDATFTTTFVDPTGYQTPPTGTTSWVVNGGSYTIHCPEPLGSTAVNMSLSGVQCSHSWSGPTTTTVFSTYSGDAGYPFDPTSWYPALTSPSITQVVAYKATTGTSLAANPNPVVLGAAITLTATVTTAEPTALGTVLFEEGSTVLGSANLAGNSGTSTASFSTSSLSLGSHTIFAVYQGDTDHEASTSGNLSVSVIQTPASIMSPMTTTTSWTVTNTSPSVIQDVSITGTLTRGTVSHGFSADVKAAEGAYAFTDNGTEMVVVNGAAGSARALLPNGTRQFLRVPPGAALSVRGLIVPFVNAIPAWNDASVTTTVLTPQTINGVLCDGVRIVPSVAANDPLGDVRRLLAPIVLWIARDTHLPYQADYFRIAGDNQGVAVQHSVRFSDYRPLTVGTNTLQVPWHLDEMLDGNVMYSLQFSNLTVNNGLSIMHFSVSDRMGR